MDILARTAAALLVAASIVFCGSGIVVDSLGVPVKDALVTRLSNGATTRTGTDGGWSFVDVSGVAMRSAEPGRRNDRLLLSSGRLRLLAGGNRDVAGRSARALPGGDAAGRAACAGRTSATSDSVSVVAAGWSSARISYDADASGNKAVLSLSSSRGMVAIDGGFDSLGSAAIANNKPHVARVAGFWIDTVEVTQRLYDSLVGRNPSFHVGCPNCPVERVSWFEAVRFCNARSRAENLPEAYDVSASDSLLWTWDPTSPGFRLPTDAEWEYAARAGSSSDWYWGPYLNKETVVKHAWYDQNAGDSTHPVGQLEPNGFGLHDVSGNVSEWTNDWFEDLGSDSLIYPKGAPGLQEWKVVRGGDFSSLNTSVISTQRSPSMPSARWLSTGFRCARGIMP